MTATIDDVTFKKQCKKLYCSLSRMKRIKSIENKFDVDQFVSDIQWLQEKFGTIVIYNEPRQTKYLSFTTNIIPITYKKTPIPLGPYDIYFYWGSAHSWFVFHSQHKILKISHPHGTCLGDIHASAINALNQLRIADVCLLIEAHLSQYNREESGRITEVKRIYNTYLKYCKEKQNNGKTT